MPLSLQNLAHAIFHRVPTLLNTQLLSLEEADWHSQPSPTMMVEHVFKESAAEGKIVFLDLLALLHKYEFHSEAENLLDRFQSKLEYHELVGALRLQLTNKQFERFKRSFARYGQQRGAFTQLANDILLLMSRADAEELFSANQQKFIITKLSKHEDYIFLKRFGWKAPTQKILLTYYNQYSHERILDFLKADPSLLYEIARYPLWVPHHRFKINLLHLALIIDDEQVVRLLLKKTPQLAVDYYLDEDKKPQAYWLLASCVPVFNAILEHEPIERHSKIKRDYYRAVFTGVVGSIPVDVYEHMNRDRMIYVRQLSWIDDNYFLNFSKSVMIIENILSEEDEIVVEELMSLIRDSALTLSILNAAMIHKASRLINLIAQVYQRKPVELLRCIAPSTDGRVLRNTLNKLKHQADYQDTLIRLCASLLSCKLDASLLIVIRQNREALFSDNRFAYWMEKNKNPKVLLACLRWGYSCSEARIIITAAFSWLIGDKDTSAKLLAFTCYAKNRSWLALLEGANLSTQSSLWASTPSVVDDSYGYGFTQDHYKDYQLNQAQLVCLYLFLGKFSFAHLGVKPGEHDMMTFDFLGKMRNHAAIVARGLKAEMFGQPREGYLTTPMTYQYASYRVQAHQNYRDNPTHFKEAKLSINDSEIILHATACWQERANLMLTRYDISNKEPAWLHTPNTNLSTILRDVQRLMNGIVSKGFILRASTKNDALYDELIKQVATIHWLLAHAAPLLRGSSSVSESICAGLMMFLGYSVTYTHQVDCEALAKPSLDQFGIAYPRFFKVKPVAADNFHGMNLILSFAKEQAARPSVIHL